MSTRNLGLALLLIVLGPACKTDAANRAGYCEALFNKAIECASGEEKQLIEGLKDVALASCREAKDRDPEEEKAGLECVHKGTCDEYKDCRQKLNDKGRTGEIEHALKTGEKTEEALMSCKSNKDGAVQKLCDELLDKSLEATTKELEAIRDSGGGDGRSKCFDLQTLAKDGSAEAKAKAEGLCKEVEASKRVKEALDEAKKYLDTGIAGVPFQCGMAVEDLEPLTSDWAKGKLQEVARACYVELGKKILPARLGKRAVCSDQLKQIHKAVKKFDLKDAELDPWIAEADAKCPE